MAIFEYKTLKIHYRQMGEGPSLLFLHGWGANKETFEALMTPLSEHYQVTAIDFPGFGASDEPDFPWKLKDYTDMTESFISSLGLVSPVLIGHSFGGRVAIELTSRIKILKMVLINSAGIKPKRSMGYYLKVYGYKTIKRLAKLPLLSWVLKEPLEAYAHMHGSSDYKQASDVMKQVLSSVVNEDLKPLLPKISASTLLIWGEDDTSTPLSDAKIMESLIPDSGLIVFPGVGHFSYIEESDRTLTILRTFLGGAHDL